MVQNVKIREVAGCLTSSGTSVILMVKYAMLIMNKTYSTLNILTANLKHLPCPSPNCKDSIWNLFEKNNRSAQQHQCNRIGLLIKRSSCMLKLKIYLHMQIWWDTPKMMKKCWEFRKMFFCTWGGEEKCKHTDHLLRKKQDMWNKHQLHFSSKNLSPSVLTVKKPIKGQVCLYYSFKTPAEVCYGTLHTTYIWISPLKKKIRKLKYEKRNTT